MKRSLPIIFIALICAAFVIAKILPNSHDKIDRVTINPTEYTEAFRNPMKGLREYFSAGSPNIRHQYPYPYGSLIKEYMQWNMLEDTVTDGIDKILEYTNHRWQGVEDINMKIIPRVYLVWVEPWHGGGAKNTITDNPDDLNGWHWPSDIPGETGPYKQIEGSVGAMVEPEDQNTPIRGGYFDPTFPERVTALVEKLGEAWDNDPRVAYIEMGIIGEWGEHHDPDISTYWPPHDEPLHVDNRTWMPGIEKVLGDAFTEAFKNKKVMVRYAYEFNDYEFGIYWDSWSQPQEIIRGYEEMLKLGDRWKTQPIGGEITWGWGTLAQFNGFEEVVADPFYRNYTIGQIRNLHCNHLGGITWADFDNPEFQKNANIMQKAMGYRFVIKAFSYPQNISKKKSFNISFKVQNTGSSPFYYNWPVELSILDTNTHKKIWSKILDNVNISEWMPGENWDAISNKYRIAPKTYNIESTLKLDKNIPDGKYIVSVSILDPAGMLPSLRFANTNYFLGGIHPMGYIGLNTNINNFEIPATEFIDIQSDTTLKYLIK